MEVAPKFCIFVYTGPVFDFGVYDSEEDYRPRPLYKNEEGDWKGFNCLYGVGGGLQYSFLRLEAGTEFGLINKKHILSDSSDLRWHKPVYASLSFMF